MLKESAVAPGMSVPLNCHWNRSSEATGECTSKVKLPPRATVVSAGNVAITGSEFATVTLPESWFDQPVKLWGKLLARSEAVEKPLVNETHSTGNALRITSSCSAN